MKNNYLIEADDFVTVNSLIKKIIKDNSFEEEIINTYDLEENMLEQVIEDLDTYSFLSPKKVIVLKNPFFLENNSKYKFNDDEIDHLVKYLENFSEDILFIICSKKLDTRKKIVKTFKKMMKYINDKITVDDVIRDELKDYKMSFKAKNLLIDYTNNNVSLLTSECIKLKLYKGEDKEITVEDIEKVVFKVKKDTDKLLFDLVEFMASRNKTKAFSTYLELLNYDYEPISIIALLETQLRLIYQIMLSQDSRISNKELASLLSVHPYRIEKSIPLVYNFTKAELNKMICDLAKLDLDIKSGTKDSRLGFKLFLINL